MNDLTKLLATKLSDFAWSLFSPAVKAYVESFLSHDKKKVAEASAVLQVSDGVAVGLAVGYYFNFMQPVDETLRNDRFFVFNVERKTIPELSALPEELVSVIGPDRARQLQATKTESHRYLKKFEPEQFQLEVVYPTALSVEAFNQAKEYLRLNTESGSYYDIVNYRPYGFNYVIENSGGSNEIIRIKDYARPIEAIHGYYSHVKRFTDEQITEVEIEEIQLYLATVWRLSQKSRESRHIVGRTRFHGIPSMPKL